MSALLGIAAIALAVGALAILLWGRARRRRREAAAENVIYLGYDDQDNVSSLRTAMMDRFKRGGFDV